MVTVHALEEDFDDSDVEEFDQDLEKSIDDSQENQMVEGVVEMVTTPVMTTSPAAGQTTQNMGSMDREVFKQQMQNHPEFGWIIQEMVHQELSKGKKKLIAEGLASKPDKVITVGPKPDNSLKSPSESTIYAPALGRVSNDQAIMVDKISYFVENMRIQANQASRNRSPAVPTPPPAMQVPLPAPAAQSTRRKDRSARRKIVRDYPEAQPGTS